MLTFVTNTTNPSSDYIHEKFCDFSKRTKLISEVLSFRESKVVGMSATWHTFCTADKRASVPELGLKQFSNPHHHATFFTLFFIFKKELYQVYSTDHLFRHLNYLNIVKITHMSHIKS